MYKRVSKGLERQSELPRTAWLVSDEQDLNPERPDSGGPALCHLPYNYSLFPSTPNRRPFLKASGPCSITSQPLTG